MEWIKIDKNKANAIPGGICCWCFDEITECIIFFNDDEFIELGRFTYYMPVKKPESPFV